MEKEGWNQEQQDRLLAALKSDYTTANLSRAEVAMLDYATKLTKTPADLTENDIKKLRAEGFDDRGIHDICVITSYFAFVNRIADGLGVELEERFTKD